MSIVRRIVLLGLSMLVAACSVTSSQPDVTLPRSGEWVLLPMVNYAQAPQAGERAEQILYTLLTEVGLTPTVYPVQTDSELPLLDDNERLQTATAWARQQGAQFAITGSIEEWQYKSGLDGEPAVGITLKAVDLSTGRILWTASAARAGWARESLAGTAQRVLATLVEEMPLE